MLFFLICFLLLNCMCTFYIYRQNKWRRDRIDHLLHDVIAESMTSSFLYNLHWSETCNLCFGLLFLSLSFGTVGPTLWIACLLGAYCGLVHPSTNSRLTVHQLRCEIVQPIYDVIRSRNRMTSCWKLRLRIRERSGNSILARAH